MLSLVTLKNDFHNSAATLRLEVLGNFPGTVTIRPSKSQVKKAKKTLCGIKGCSCGNDIGIRGPKTWNGKRLEVDLSEIYA